MAQLAAGLLAFVLSAFTALPAGAQSYPSRQVRIIVPFAAGGPADIYARVLGQHLQQALGQPFVIEDRPGGGSIVGTDVAAKAEPDGYTLLMMSNTHTVNESLRPHKPFQLMRDFVPVAPVNYSDLVLVVNPSVPVNTLKDLIALAKAKPHALNYASSGPGTPYHMAGELFKAMAGAGHRARSVQGQFGCAHRCPRRAGADDVRRDYDHGAACARGEMKALATTGKTRSPVLPDVPTMSEAGVPGYEAVIWLGVMAPKGTPDAIVQRLNAEIRKIVNNPEVKQAWAKQGATPMSMSTDEFGQLPARRYRQMGQGGENLRRQGRLKR